MKGGLFIKVIITSLIVTLLPPLAHTRITTCEQWPYSYGGAMKPGGLSTEELSDFDFIVIGGGLSGSVIAKRLSENPLWKILVLEAGGNYGRSYDESAFLYTEPDWRAGLAFRNHSTYWRRGAYITSPMRWVYGMPEDYDSWHNNGNPEWRWDDVEPYFAMSTAQTENAFAPEGYVEVNVLGRRDYDKGLYDAQNAVFEGLKELMTINGRRLEAQSDVSDYEMKYATQKLGIHHCNKRVFMKAEVMSIGFDPSGKSVDKVTFIMRGNNILEARFRKELILAAGPIDSAKILMLSGVGPESHLTPLKIPVVHDLPVGLGLQDHLVVPLLFEVPDLEGQTARSKPLPPNGSKSKIYKRGLFGYQGELVFSAFYNLNLSAIPNGNDIVELHYFYISKNDTEAVKAWSDNFHLKEQYEKKITDMLLTKNFLIVHVVLSHPKSKGRVTLASNDYSDLPIISTNYFDNSDDLRTMSHALRNIFQITETPAFKRKGVRFLNNLAEDCHYAVNSEDQWRCYISYFSTTQFDHVGTVRMGPPEYGNCVDSRLLLNGVDNLRVVGASVMPSLPSGEVGAASVMIAERAADFIKEDWGEGAYYI